MKKISFLIILLSLSLSALQGEETETIGFGLQITLPNPVTDKNIIAKKILGDSKYKLTPGDVYKFIITVDKPVTTTVILSNNYELELPILGTLNVKGMYYSDLRKLIITRVKQRTITQYVDFILESPAIFDVFIYGGVTNPGFVTVMSMTPLSDAIAMAKGFKPGGSYRQIQIFRNNQLLTFDLSKYIAQANMDQNPKLEPGDKIYVPHAEIYTEIKGNVAYPDRYEMLPGETLMDLIKLAGDILPGTETSAIEIIRLNGSGKASLMQVSYELAEKTTLQNGDAIRIKSRFENQTMILVEGALFGKPVDGNKPQQIPTTPLVFNHPYIPELSLYQLLQTLGGPTPLADTENSYIIRKTEQIPVDVKTLWETGDSNADITLQKGDHIFIPMKKLKIVVAGEVNKPGAFNFQTGGTVGDYLMLAGGINPDNGSIQDIYEVDQEGNQKKIHLTDFVRPGQVIYAGKNLWRSTTYSLDQIGVIIAFTASAVALATAIVELTKSF